MVDDITAYGRETVTFFVLKSLVSYDRYVQSTSWYIYKYSARRRSLAPSSQAPHLLLLLGLLLIDSPSGCFCILQSASSGLLRTSWEGLPSRRRPSNDLGDGDRRYDGR